jgi:hypothetical protein
VSILVLLIQFVFRVTFGVALAMAVTPSRWVTSGFYRVHLWVLMGLNTLASLCIYTQRESLQSTFSHVSLVLTLGVSLAVASYLGGAFWLYEKKRAGTAALFLVMVGGLLAAIFATPWHEATTSLGISLAFLDLASSGLLLGVTLSAMFLGHWYLNTPTMELLPLKRLVLLMAAAVLIRTLVSGTGLVLQARSTAPMETVFWIFVALRWLSGLLGAFMMALMTWYTLKVPNTQSATGILYAGVILTFIGELTSQFLSLDALYPL